MRIESLDVLRGIAILGILVMNIYFHGVLFLGYIPPEVVPFTDAWVDTFNAIFADGRFRTIFCILFGAGLAIQYDSCQKKGLNYRDFLTSRLYWLMIFGIIHGVFIFGGDILLVYSICGMFILKFLDRSVDELWKKSVTLLVIGSVISVVIFVVLIVLGGDEPEITRNSQTFAEEYNNWMGNYLSQLTQQALMMFSMLLALPFWLYWQLAGLMLLGVYLYRAGFFESGLKSHEFKLVVSLAVVFSAVDILSRWTFFGFGNQDSSIFAGISAIFVGLLYMHWVISLVKQRAHWPRLFVAPGRIAFSLYIMQSLVFAGLFRWVNPEFYLTATMIEYLGIALVCIVLQLMLANWYLKFFDRGPLEALWRYAYLRSFEKKQRVIQTN